MGFCKRKLLWNKWTGDVRIENPSANQVILVNINTLKGKVYENGTFKTRLKLMVYLKEGIVD
jgi:hypothetical protein